MPRYHLNLFLDEDVLDEEGIDRPDLGAATAEAIAGGRSIIIELIARGHLLDLRHRIEVTDEIGRVLATISFRELVTITDD